ncbi:MAG: hypothetical protein IJQ58_09500 [Synergistaceae bacterium]|nr:hypothetical protein [Synergistaceae bacterium]
MRNVQSFIANISVPKTPEDLFWFMDEYGMYVLENFLDSWDEPGNWTVPRWAKIGDIVFFTHAVTAGQYLKAIRNRLKERKDSYTQEDFDRAMEFISDGLELHSEYGGKIFSVARVTGAPEYQKYDEPFYWHSSIYADIGDAFMLENPVDVSEFKSFLPIARQSSITPVIGSNFDRLREIIISHGNKVPSWFTEATAAPLPLSAINSENWLELCYEYRNRFFLEEQFRKFYADYLLRALSDDGRLYSECRIRKAGSPDSFADNVIMLHGRYVVVEVKLNIKNEPSLTTQLTKYCNADSIFKGRDSRKAFPAEKTQRDSLLVIDTEALYLYRQGEEDLSLLLPLSDLKHKKEIPHLREKILRII